MVAAFRHPASITLLSAGNILAADTITHTPELKADSSQLNGRTPLDVSDAAIDSLYADRKPHSLINRESSDIENPVVFSAKDSIVFYNQNNAHMFGNSTVEYGEFKLNAGHVQMDMDSSTVYAAPLPDSISNGEDTRPVFRDHSGEYELSLIHI